MNDNHKVHNVRLKSGLIRSNFFYMILIIIHLLGILFYFNAVSLFSDAPIINVDYPYHQYFCEIGKDYHNEGHLWGYSPYFKAGYGSGLALDNELMQIYCTIMPFSSDVAIKIWVLTFLLILPILIYFSVKNFGLGRRAAIIGLSITILYIFTDHHFKQMLYFGIFNSVFANFLSIFFLSLFYRYIDRRDFSIWYLIVIFPLFPLMHSSMLFSFFIPFVLLCVYRWKKINDYKIFIPIILSAAILAYWVYIPFLQNIGSVAASTGRLYRVHSLNEIIRDLTLGHIRDGLGLIKAAVGWIVIIGLSFSVMIRPKIKSYERIKKMYFFIPHIALLFIFLYLHYMIPLLSFLYVLQPYKYAVTLVVVMIIIASNHISILYDHFSDSIRSRRIMISCLLIVPIAALVIDAVSSDGSQQIFEVSGSEDYDAITDWIKDNKSDDSRIMIAIPTNTTELFNKGGMLQGMIAKHTGSQIIGGPHLFPSLKQDFPYMNDFRMFDVYYRNFNPKAIQYYLESYNIGYILVKTEKTNSVLDRMEELGYVEKVGSAGKYKVFATKHESSFIIGAEGKVEAEMNRIMITGLQRYEDEIILKYHYHHRLDVTDGLMIEPVLIEHIPIPFIKISGLIDREIESFTVYNSYGLS